MSGRVWRYALKYLKALEIKEMLRLELNIKTKKNSVNLEKQQQLK